MELLLKLLKVRRKLGRRLGGRLGRRLGGRLRRVGGVKYLMVCIKEGAVCKDLVNTDMQVSVTVAPSPVTAYKPFDSST